MPRTFCWLAAIVVIALPCRADEIISGSETLIRLRVSPAPAPKPALKYQLLPELAEMNPGNPVQSYMKCFMEQQKFFFDKAAFDRREKLLAMPLKELQGQDMLEYGGFPLTQADWAARLDTPDWQVLLKIKSDWRSLCSSPSRKRFGRWRIRSRYGFDPRSPPAGSTRPCAPRKTMFAMARHLGEHPTLIGTLVGLSMANSAIGPLEELIEQPGSPNLYWALTALPAPLVSVEMGADAERLWPTIELWDLDEAAPMTAERLSRFMIRLEKLLGNGTAPSKRAGDSHGRGTADQGHGDARGCPPPADRGRGFRRESQKLSARPDHPARREARGRSPPRRHPEAHEPAALAGGQAGQPDQTMRRTEALRRTGFVEGLAWESTGGKARLSSGSPCCDTSRRCDCTPPSITARCPRKLSDISVPLPDDPFTGKPFRYEQNGATGPHPRRRGAAQERQRPRTQPSITK